MPPMIQSMPGAVAKPAAEHAADGRGGLVGLKHVAATEGATDAKQGKHEPEQFGNQEGKPSLLEADFQVVHRSAIDRAVGMHLAIDLGERALVELGRHAKQADQHHPDNSAWAAQLNRHRHARDVAQADGRAEG